MTMTPEQEARCREAFETEFTKRDRHAYLERDETGDYMDDVVRIIWGYWQTAWSAAQARSPDERLQIALKNLPPEGKRDKPQEWEAAYAMLFNQFTAMVEENSRLKAAQTQEWQPIETAPRDGTHILLLRGEISEGWWRLDIFEEKYEWGGKGWSYPEWSQPTHWMPLPTPPEQPSSGEAGNERR